MFPSPTQKDGPALPPLVLTHDCVHSRFPLLQGEKCDFPSLSHGIHLGFCVHCGWQHGLLPLRCLFPQGLGESESLNPRAKAKHSLTLQDGAALRLQVTSQGEHPLLKAELVL